MTGRARSNASNARSNDDADPSVEDVPVDAGVVNEDDLVDVHVSDDDDLQEAASKLLKAARDLNLDEEHAVESLGSRAFRVHKKVASKAGYQS